MDLAEPGTTLTDYALFGLGAALGVSLWRHGRREGQLCQRLWGVALLATALAALAGGTYHGFAPRLGKTTLAILWRLTYSLVGLGSFFILSGAVIAAVPARVARPLTLLLVLRFVAYAAFLSRHQDFRYVLYDYGLTLVVLFALALFFPSLRATASSFIVAGVLVSALGAIVQRSGFSLHPELNHNVLFHLVQMLGLYFFYRGGLQLRDHQARGRARL